MQRERRPGIICRNDIDSSRCRKWRSSNQDPLNPTHEADLVSCCQFVLPNPKYPPAFVSQYALHQLITNLVRSNFPIPIGTIRLRHSTMSRTAVPEAAIDERRQLVLWKHEIRMPRNGNMSAPTADSVSAQESGESEFCKLVPATLNGAHDLRTLFTRNRVRSSRHYLEHSRAPK